MATKFASSSGFICLGTCYFITYHLKFSLYLASCWSIMSLISEFLQIRKWRQILSLRFFGYTTSRFSEFKTFKNIFFSNNSTTATCFLKCFRTPKLKFSLLIILKLQNGNSRTFFWNIFDQDFVDIVDMIKRIIYLSPKVNFVLSNCVIKNKIYLNYKLLLKYIKTTVS